MTTLDEREEHFFIGFWKRSIPYINDSLAMDPKYDEPHAKRRIAILESYPEIRKLYGKCATTCPLILVSLLIHFFVAHFSVHFSWLLLIVVSFFVGATLCQLMGVFIHEATHDLIFKNSLYNVLLLYLCNLPIPVPISASFKRYHLEHHAFQGVIGKDPDLPLDLEYKLVKGSPLLKLCWILIYPMLYAIRGLSMKKRPSLAEVVNVFYMVSFQLFLYRAYNWDLRFILYYWLSFYFGFSIHPAAAHFVQEHFTWADGQETYSYYGILNFIFLNIGYHNEHHDFSQVPWISLPKITKIAPEFYVTNQFTYHTSWIKVYVDFIFSEKLGPQSRLARPYEAHISGREMIPAARLHAKGRNKPAYHQVVM